MEILLKSDDMNLHPLKEYQFKKGHKVISGSEKGFFKKGSLPPKHKEGCQCFRCNPRPNPILTLICYGCKKEFQTKNPKRKFCSPHCNHKNGMLGEHIKKSKEKIRELREKGIIKPYWKNKSLPEYIKDKISYSTTIAMANLTAEKRERMINAHLGKYSWNKNLTKETDERLRKSGKKSSKTKIRLFTEGILVNPLKNKTFEEYYGYEKAEKLRKVIKNARMNQLLPVKDTSIEVKIQNFLKLLNIEFFTHQYMHIEHGYQCDIFIPSVNLIIECDGDYWHKYPTGRDIDHIRTKELQEKRYKVLRLWENEIKKMNIEKFRERLMVFNYEK